MENKKVKLKETLQKITVINEPYTKWKWRERTTTYGDENEDKTFFVIRRASCKVGLFSFVMTNMGLVDYAINKGYIPVIDMKNSENTYLEPDQVGKINAWEFYFNQPMGYGLGDISKSKNIILSNGLITKQNNYPDIRIAKNEELLKKWKNVFDRYFQIKDDLLTDFVEVKQKMFQGKRVLGVLARGTDYISLRPKNHPIQPTTQQIIEKASEIMEKYHCDYVYVATEDEKIYNHLKNYFGNRMLAINTLRYSTNERENINDIISNKESNKYSKGREYLLTIWLLSQCNCLVGGNVGGTQGALLMSSGYEFQYIFDLGVYQ